MLHWADLRADERCGTVTSPVRTVLDCAMSLPFPEALAVADSALRLRLVAPDDLRAVARARRGPGRARVAAVAEAADARAESPLESAMRAIVITAGVPGFEPQLVIDEDGLRVRSDLGDRSRRIVLEADSFEHHGHRRALVRDCWRYDELTIRGWRVLRFAWEHVMFEPDWVAATVRSLVEADRNPSGRHKPGRRRDAGRIG